MSPAARVSVTALATSLDQLSELLGETTDRQYVMAPVGAFVCSLGGQIRHVLDHIRCLTRHASTGVLDYDERERGTDIEHHRDAAVHEIARLIPAMDALTTRRTDEPCPVVVHTYDTNAPSTTVMSSLGREVAFVLSHTVHHCAVIGAMATELGILVPSHFGVAPATLAHLGAD